MNVCVRLCEWVFVRTRASESFGDCETSANVSAFIIVWHSHPYHCVFRSVCFDAREIIVCLSIMTGVRVRVRPASPPQQAGYVRILALPFFFFFFFFFANINVLSVSF